MAGNVWRDEVEEESSRYINRGLMYLGHDLHVRWWKSIEEWWRGAQSYLHLGKIPLAAEWKTDWERMSRIGEGEPFLEAACGFSKQWLPCFSLFFPPCVDQGTESARPDTYPTWPSGWASNQTGQSIPVSAFKWPLKLQRMCRLAT